MSLPLYGTGLAVGLDDLDGLQFDPSGAFTGCRVCGAVYQREIDRHPEKYAMLEHFDGNLQLVIEYATATRKEWSHRHANRHTQKEHDDLAMSGRWCTPEAATKFAALGIIPLRDAALDDEVRDALANAPSVPSDDVEGYDSY